MTEQAAHRLANALINFKLAFNELTDASKAVPDYDISESYPFYLLDYEEIAPAVAQWCNIQATKLLKQLTYDVPSPIRPQPIETPTVEPKKETEPEEVIESVEAKMTGELLLIAKLMDGKTFDDYPDFEDAVADYIMRAAPVCHEELKTAGPGVTIISGEMRNFIRQNAIINFRKEVKEA